MMVLQVKLGGERRTISRSCRRRRKPNYKKKLGSSGRWLSGSRLDVVVIITNRKLVVKEYSSGEEMSMSSSEHMVVCYSFISPNIERTGENLELVKEKGNQ